MKILGIDSSGMVAGAAVVADDIVLAEYNVNFKKTHSETLLPMIDEIVKMTELDLNTIDAIAVAAGPGSFTGLRIGSSTAKGLGLALGKNIIPVPTCHALAYNIWGVSGLVCPIMDARRNQVYTGIYDCENREPVVISDQRAMDINDLIEELADMNKSVIFLGDGVPVYKKVIEEKANFDFRFAPPHCNRQRAASVAALGAIYMCKGIIELSQNHSPIYLRKSQAEREREENICNNDCDILFPDEIAKLEKICFSDSWSGESIEDTLSKDYNLIVVACEDKNGNMSEQIIYGGAGFKERFLKTCHGVFNGYIIANLIGDESELLRIAVVPSKRKMHIGYRLLKKYLENTGAASYFLEVREGNIPARGLYEKAGYKEVSVRKGYYQRPPEDAVIYEFKK